VITLCERHKQVSWTEKLLSLIMSKREEKPLGPVTDGPGMMFYSVHPLELHLAISEL